MSDYTYKELKTNIECVQSIQEFHLVQEINEHVHMKMTAVVKESYEDKYVKSATGKEQVKVTVDKEVLFQGMIEMVEVKQEGGFYYLILKGVSNSYEADLSKKRRSFQDKNRTYYDMVKTIISEYAHGGVIDTASQGAAIGTIQLQYYETDWNYIKRMASHFNAGIVADCTLNGPKIYFGVPAGNGIGKIEDHKYRITKNLAKYKKASGNTNKKVKEKDSTVIHITTDRNYNIGDRGTFNGAELYIRRKEIKMSGGILRFHYELSTKNGMSRSTIFNEKMAGVSIKGKVLERVRDHLKIHLEIDEKQDKGTAWLFPYATMYASEGNSGWYCMPEENDTVLVYFPDTDAGNAVGTGSVRVQGSAGDKIDNPQVKYFRTADGKEVMFSPEGIVITCSDNSIFINMDQNNGITISSAENITISSDKEIKIEAEEEITISAEEKIDITCKSGQIKMDGDIDIRGDEVRVN